jgi:hypothetical protein
VSGSGLEEHRVAGRCGVVHSAAWFDEEPLHEGGVVTACDVDVQLDEESDQEIPAPGFGSMIGVAPESSVCVLDWGKVVLVEEMLAVL